MNSKNRPLSSLDVFILALIDSGVATSYAMREEAGVSVGASRPALQRLKELGLVAAGEMEARGKRAFKLTHAGRRAKSAGLELLLDEYRAMPPSDAESILRVAALAISEARSSEAKELLRKAADEFHRRSQASVARATDTESAITGIYRTMLAAVSVTQAAALSGGLAELTKFCRKSPPHPRIKHSRTKQIIKWQPLN